jgi:predicted DCC family thiol-disulfide oxidoreductase YuxK
VSDEEQAPVRPLLIFDGACTFCRRWVARWQHATGERVDYAPASEAAARFPEIPAERFKEAVVLIEPDGRVSHGAEAAFGALAVTPWGAWLLRCYRHLPGFAPLSELLYRQVARHRGALSKLTEIFWGPHLVPPGETLTCWLYLRLLAVVYLIAFASLGVQVLGLLGHDGILPARDFLAAVHERFGASGRWYVPTVLWWNASDAALVAVCIAGATLAVLLLAGIAPVLTLCGLWIAYLSLVSVGQDFLSFQWDSLLLEAGLIAILLAPWRGWSRPGSDPAPPRLAVWLTRWLLFRLMFSSAAAKLASGDTSWRDLTALTYHYETQCLPPWPAWYAHHLPLAWQRFSCGAMFAIEGVVPFLFVAPRRIRFAAAGVTAAFQLLILLTGNYGFFNWLTLALCVMLLDDGVWRRSPPAGMRPPGVEGRGRWPAWVVRPVALALLALGLVPLFDVLGWSRRALGPLPAIARWSAPYCVVNRYGLFANMTRTRSEIVLEGSDDASTWRAYEFRWKPGDVMRHPAFVAPYHPRLDWQMWFAALTDFRSEPWFLELCRRVLAGSAPVLGLLESNPFPRAPPRYLRAVVYDYHFSDAGTRRTTGAWWIRRPLGLYCPVLTLVDGQLVAVPMTSFQP